MTPTNGFDEAMRAVSNVLFWCFGMSMVVLFLWFGMLFVAHDLVFDFHSMLFEMSENQFDLMHYMLGGMLKVGALAFFLFPAVGIRLVVGWCKPEANS